MKAKQKPFPGRGRQGCAGTGVGRTKPTARRSLSQPGADSSLYAREPAPLPPAGIPRPLLLGEGAAAAAGVEGTPIDEDRAWFDRWAWFPSSVTPAACHLPRRGRLPPAGVFLTFPWGKVPPQRRMRGGTRLDFVPPHTRPGSAGPPSPRRGFFYTCHRPPWSFRRVGVFSSGVSLFSGLSGSCRSRSFSRSRFSQISVSLPARSRS